MASTSEFVASYLRALNEKRRHEVLMDEMSYPKTGTINTDDKPIAACTYRCSGPQCDFSEAFKCIAQNVDLRAFQAEPVLKEVLQDIEAHPQEHLAHVLDGFEVYRCGFNLLRLRRLDEKGNETSGSRTGILEHNNIRARALEELQQRRMQAIFDNATVNQAGNQGCVLL